MLSDNIHVQIIIVFILKMKDTDTPFARYLQYFSVFLIISSFLKYNEKLFLN